MLSFWVPGEVQLTTKLVALTAIRISIDMIGRKQSAR